MVSTKAALSIRVDALADPDEKSTEEAPSIGVAHRAKLESRLRALEYALDGTSVKRFGDSGRKQTQKFEMGGETKTYNSKADEVLLSTQREDPMAVAIKVVQDVKDEKKRAKEERRAKRKSQKAKASDDDEADSDVDSNAMAVDEPKKEKKEKKRKRRESEPMNVDEPDSPAKVRTLVRPRLA